MKILEQERDLLLSHPETERLARRILDVSSPTLLTGEDDEIDLLRDACGELLQRIGFDENYLPTQDGRLLENLIDKLFIDEDHGRRPRVEGRED